MSRRTAEKRIMFKATSRATRCSPRLNPTCIDLLTQTALLARRKTMHKTFDEVVQESRSEYNTLAGPVRIPIEIFHRIASLLPPESLMALFYTCRNLRRKLSFDIANLVWYKAIPAAILRAPAMYCAARSLEPVLALGGPFSNGINYCIELEGFMTEANRCNVCCAKDSKSHPFCSVRWGKLLCKACFRELRIEKPELLALLALLATPEGHTLTFTVQHLKVERSGTRDYFYRPLVDCIIRRTLTIGLSDLELNEKLQRRAREGQQFQEQHSASWRLSVQASILNAAEHVWEYMKVVCADICTDQMAEVAFDLLCNQLQQEKWVVRECMQGLFDEADTLDSAVINMFQARFASDIRPFCREITDREILHDTGDEVLDGDLRMNSRPDEFICPKYLHYNLDDVHQPTFATVICRQAVHMIITLIDVYADGYFERVNTLTTWVSACKDYHRRMVHADLDSGVTMRMEFTPPISPTNLGSRIFRGITDLRSRLHLPLDPPKPSDYLVLDDSSDHLVLDEEAYQAAQKHEERAKKYFKKICVKACGRCPVSSLVLQPVGLESMLDHVAANHPWQFWLGDIHLLG